VFEPNLPFPPVPGDADGIRESRRAVPKNRQVSPNRVRRQDQADRPGRDPLRRVLDARRVRRRRGPGCGARGVRVVVRGRRLCLRLGGGGVGMEGTGDARAESVPAGLCVRMTSRNQRRLRLRLRLR
jgi:hypothetical protein